MSFVAKIAFWLEFCNNSRVKTLIYYQFLFIVSYSNFQADRFYFFFQYIKEYILLNLPGFSEKFPPLKNDNY